MFHGHGQLALSSRAFRASCGRIYLHPTPAWSLVSFQKLNESGFTHFDPVQQVLGMLLKYA